MDQPAERLVPAANVNNNDLVKVNDTNNRTARVAANSGFWSAAVYALNRWTNVDFTAEDLVILLPTLMSVTAYVVNLAEYRGWIPSTKKEGAEIAPPKNDMGQTLAQVK